MEPFIGQIQLFAFNRAPSGWQPCDGQVVSISRFPALYSLIGTTYGGDGTSTFALPDLRGRAPIHAGQGPGLSPRLVGEAAGAETVTLAGDEMPAHAHPVVATTASTSRSPTGTVPGLTEAGASYGEPLAGQVGMAPAMIGSTGGSQPHANMPPFLAMSYCIAVEGTFPSFD